jgi:hypothetical protein
VATGRYRAEVLGERELFRVPRPVCEENGLQDGPENCIKIDEKEHRKSMNGKTELLRWPRAGFRGKRAPSWTSKCNKNHCRESWRGFAVATGRYRAEVLGERELFRGPRPVCEESGLQDGPENCIKIVEKEHRKSMKC